MGLDCILTELILAYFSGSVFILLHSLHRSSSQEHKLVTPEDAFTSQVILHCASANSSTVDA